MRWWCRWWCGGCGRWWCAVLVGCGVVVVVGGGGMWRWSWPSSPGCYKSRRGWPSSLHVSRLQPLPCLPRQDEVRAAFAGAAAATSDGRLWPRPDIVRLRKGDGVLVRLPCPSTMMMAMMISADLNPKGAVAHVGLGSLLPSPLLRPFRRATAGTPALDPGSAAQSGLSARDNSLRAESLPVTKGRRWNHNSTDFQVE